MVVAECDEPPPEFAAVDPNQPHRRPTLHRAFQRKMAIRVLIEHGAVWKPDDSLNDVRRTLCGIDPEVTVELVGMLVRHRACDDATLHDLLRTQRMQQHMKSSEQRLSRAGVTLAGGRKSETREARNAPPSPYLLRRYDREKLYNEVWSEPTQEWRHNPVFQTPGRGRCAGS